MSTKIKNEEHHFLRRRAALPAPFIQGLRKAGKSRLSVLPSKSQLPPFSLYEKAYNPTKVNIPFSISNSYPK